MSDQPEVKDVRKVYSEACRLTEGLLVSGGSTPPLDDFGRQRLERAVLLFSTVIHFNPTHWPSLWLLGKTAQRLGDLVQAFNYFRLASNCNPNHPDVLRETTIASMEIGRVEDALIYGSRAVEIDPQDAGLRANLALALLFSEKVEEAKVVVEEAKSRDPSNPITERLRIIIGEVHRGERPCPHHVRDLK